MWVIDTDSILKLYHDYNPRFFAGLWQEIDGLMARGYLWSTRVNYEEIKQRAGEEEIEAWKRAHEAMFLEVDDIVQGFVVEILTIFPDLIDSNSDQEQADPYLIGLARKMKAVVITEETPLEQSAMANPKRKKKMKIPNVCDHYGIASMNLARFVNSEEWRSLR